MIPMAGLWGLVWALRARCSVCFCWCIERALSSGIVSMILHWLFVYCVLFIVVNADMWVTGAWFRELVATIFSGIVLRNPTTTFTQKGDNIFRLGNIGK
jgi:hypothetical protein